MIRGRCGSWAGEINEGVVEEVGQPCHRKPAFKIKQEIQRHKPGEHYKWGAAAVMLVATSDVRWWSKENEVSSTESSERVMALQKHLWMIYTLDYKVLTNLPVFKKQSVIWALWRNLNSQHESFIEQFSYGSRVVIRYTLYLAAKCVLLSNLANNWQPPQTNVEISVIFILSFGVCSCSSLICSECTDIWTRASYGGICSTFRR